MKQILLSVISFYQMIISPVMRQLLGVKSQCRFSPTCSTYAKQVINEYGVVKGSVLAMKRILSCQPFTKSYGYN